MTMRNFKRIDVGTIELGMTKDFVFARELARTLIFDDPAMQEGWRARVRQLFADVDGAELLFYAKNQRNHLYAALVKGQSSSMYAIPLRPVGKGQGDMIDFGVVRDPEWFGDQDAEVGGLMLWCSEGFDRRFNELIGRYGIAAGATFSLGGGTAIDLQGRVSNADLCDLARLTVLELVAAFDITGREWAQQDRIVLAELLATDFASMKKRPL